MLCFCSIQPDFKVSLCCPSTSEELFPGLPTSSDAAGTTGYSSDNNVSDTVTTGIINGGFNNKIRFAGPTNYDAANVVPQKTEESIHNDSLNSTCGVSNEVRVVGGQPIRVRNRGQPIRVSNRGQPIRVSNWRTTNQSK